MFKQILALLMLVVVVKSQNNYTALRTDDYNTMNERQHAATIEKYDNQMQTFKDNYALQINTIAIQRDMLIDGLLQNDEKLNPLELMSEKSKECVVKYRSLIPTIAWVQKTIDSCATTATNQLNSLLSPAVSTKNTLQNYYTNNYAKSITNCNTTYPKQGLNHTLCVVGVTSTTNTYTINNQKTFATQMDTAGCSGKAHIKKALDCNFSAQNQTTSLIAQANTLIDRCLLGLDGDCSPCKQGDYSCSSVYYIPQYQVDYKNLTMINPFYGRNETECLMLSIY